MFAHSYKEGGHMLNDRMYGNNEAGPPPFPQCIGGPNLRLNLVPLLVLGTKTFLK